MAAAAPTARPIVKWVGGKTRLLPELLKRVPKTFGTYLEPFVGGGALFFRLAPEKAILGDLNESLIQTYWALRECPKLVTHRLKLRQAEHYRRPRTTFYRERKKGMELFQGSIDESVARAARFIYLNRTCFNGLWRVNKQGQFNVPMGRYKRPRICDEAGLLAASEVLQRASVHHASYSVQFSRSRPGDFIFADPPYEPISKTSNFTSYTAETFNRTDQIALEARARDAVGRGVKVMLSNSDTPFIRELYKDKCWKVERVYAPRAINSDPKRRGKVAEVIITGGYRRHW
jgi:DNA adenine methylase